MIRARAGISFALAEAMDDGHCGLPTDELRTLAAELLEIPPEVVDAALELELADGAIVVDTVDQRACVFLAGLHRAERDIAERLLRLAKGRPPCDAASCTKCDRKQREDLSHVQRSTLSAEDAGSPCRRAGG